jgi:hypothetical protein
MLADTMKQRESAKNDDAMDLLMDIIDRGRSICGQPKLNPAELDSTAEAWDDFLRANHIPQQRYWECFDEFRRGDRQGKFTVYDLRDAWLRLSTASHRTFAPMEEIDVMCGGCGGSGWAFREIVIEGNGRKWKTLRGGGVRPCECPKGRRYDQSYAKAKS